MSTPRLLLVVWVLFVGAIEARAQVFVWPSPIGPAGVSGGGISISTHHKHFSLSLSNSYGPHPVLPYPSGPVFNPYSPGYPPMIGRLTVIQGYSPPPPPPPVVVIMPSPRREFDELPPELPPRRQILADLPRPDQPPEERPLVGKDAGGFRPIKPDERDRARRPIPAEPPPKPEAPAPKPPEAKPPAMPLDKPLDDPKAEHARQIILGKDAFAHQAYGRAAQHFGRATTLLPGESMGHFLFAQALFALGKYREAVDAIHVGLRLQPDWPAAPFRPLELYDVHVVDYSDQLKALEEILGQRPRDPVLLFLYAYQLWFDGRKDEAWLLFKRAAAVVPDKSDCERFLRGMPGIPIV
jgi:hypothetical protein